jgi:hypothetical protein
MGWLNNLLHAKVTWKHYVALLVMFVVGYWVAWWLGI